MAEVWTLATGLEVEKLDGVVFLRERAEADLIRSVVVLNEILDDGSGFPQGDAGIWILNGGNAVMLIRGTALAGNVR